MLSLLWSDQRVRTSNLIDNMEVPKITLNQDLRLIFQYRF